MSPPKFHYAKNSDEPLSGRFSVAQRIFLRAHTSLSASKDIGRAASEVYRQVETGFPLSLHLELKSRTPICIFNSIPFFLHFQQFIYAPGTQHWVSEFHTFDDAPEVFATYQLRNNKSNRLYTDKFSIHMIDSTRIDLAIEEDKYYEIDR